ncbi:MAG: hypothetical protein GY771_16210 [bacterium]|nr:hypothetical protein [bacterium]
MIASQQDDAYYYLEIAQNIGDGKGVTFDGTHETNGFHPLWLLILTAVSAIPGLGGVTLVRAVMILQALLYLGTLVLIKKNAEAVLNPFMIAALLLVTVYPRFFQVFLSGMESGLVVMLLLLLFYLLPRFINKLYDEKWALYSLMLGGLLGATALTRVDTVFFAAAILIFIVVNDRRQRRAFTSATYGAFVAGGVIVVVLLPFMLWNYVNFGTIATTSSLMKIEWNFSDIGTHAVQMLMGFPEYLVAFIISLVGTGIVFVNKRYLRRELRRTFLRPLGLFIIAATVLLTFYFLFHKWALNSYALAFLLPIIILGVITVFIALREEIKFGKKRRVFALVMFALAIPVAVGTQIYSMGRREMGMTIRVYETAIWAKENTPDDAVFAMKDCGVFGYYSERDTINLDGLVNDLDYQEYLRDGKLEEYLELNGVDYFVQHAFWFDDYPVNAGDYETYTLYIPSRIYDGTGDAITVAKPQEFYRSDYYQPRGQDRTRVIIWEMKP